MIINTPDASAPEKGGDMRLKIGLLALGVVLVVVGIVLLITQS